MKSALVCNFSFPNKKYADKLPADTIEANLEQINV